MVVPVGLSIMIALVCAVGLGAWNGIETLTTASGWVNHTHVVDSKLRRLLSLHIDAETGQRGFMYTGKDEFLEPYVAALTEIEERTDELKKLIGDNPTQLARLSEVEALSGQKLDELAQTIALKRGVMSKRLFPWCFQERVKLLWIASVSRSTRWLWKRTGCCKREKGRWKALFTPSTSSLLAGC
ncbi:hypothetical protein BOW53_08210 [Solemya pervernicosa gill symbiont]|uniref:CHASE3 domain-containing protein n=1 Tax=Solemya pervernicosa gill symbiont TaxID=642797 RepID=A0A1T2L5D5_9GAMM|nr:hypothetical protein BOW53_08210 [Solemya pervernicosa gill symbiont]